LSDDNMSVIAVPYS